MADIAENIFKAMEILMDKKIKSIHFDETISAIIVDDSEAKKGKYLVSSGDAKFYAYGPESQYKNNQTVMVTIPQGNYDNQKMIIGKQDISDGNEAISYESPFDQIIDLTGNLIPAEDNNVFSFSANGENYIWDIDTDFNVSNPIWSWSSESPLVGYSRIGLAANFRTYLNELNTVAGNYGLALELTFEILEEVEDSNITKSFTKLITFDSKHFFGNIFDFVIPTHQEDVYNISDYLDFGITNIKLFIYQRNNFINNLGERISANLDIGNNIFIDNFYICLGEDVSTFNKDVAKIVTADPLTYHKNDTQAKHIDLRWIHLYEEDENLDNNKAPVRLVLNEDDKPTDYNIYWYQYQIGASSPDQFAGAHWIKLDNNDNFTLNFLPTDNGNTTEREQIKVIITKELAGGQGSEKFIAESNVLTFTNKDEIPHIVTMQHDSALGIKFNDDELGHYFLYNRAKRASETEANEIRILTAVFDPDLNKNLYDKPVLSDFDEIQWIFPKENTMIIPATAANETAQQLFDYDDETFHWIKTENDTNEEEHISIGYFIKKELNRSASNNIINLYVKKDSIIYHATASMSFGTAGTSGSDYTLDIYWQNEYDIPVYDINRGKKENNYFLKGLISLQDHDGKQVILPNEANLEVEWEQHINWLANFSFNDGQTYAKEYIKEEKDIFYPILPNSNKRFNGITYSFETENSYTLDYYYYDFTTKEWKEKGSTSNLQYYRKRRDGEEPFNKIIFKEVKIPEDENYVQGKFFIQYNNQYLIDPWESFDSSEIYYKPEYVSEKIVNKTENLKLKIKAEIDEETAIKQYYVKIYQTDKTIFINRDNLYILKLTLSNFGDYPLIIQRPIALKYINENENDNKKYEILSIDGPTEIRYATDGEIDLNKTPYTAKIKINNKIYNFPEDFYGSIRNNNIFSIDKDLQPTSNEKFLGGWRLIYQTSYYYTPCTANAEGYFYKLQQNQNGKITMLEKAFKNSSDHNNYWYYRTSIGNSSYSLEDKMMPELNELVKTAIFTKINKNSANLINGGYKNYYISLYSKDFQCIYTKFSEELAENFQDIAIFEYDPDNGPDHLAYKIITDRFISLEDFKNNDYYVQVFSDPEHDTTFIKYSDFNSLNFNYRQDPLQYYFKSERTKDQYFFSYAEGNFQNGYYQEDYLIYILPWLNPSDIYFKETRPFGIQFLDKNLDILWTQPILVYQDNYPSTTLNKWNGKNIQTDEDTGTIVANGFAAGRKESDNTFTGVVLGDWSRTDADRCFAVENTGVFGFEHGAMSYALKDDGTAFFGKDGHGRIYLNGNKATITSAGWRGDNKQGMLLDLDDGLIDVRGHNSSMKMSLNESVISMKNNNSEITLSTANNGTFIKMSKGTGSEVLLSPGDNGTLFKITNNNKPIISITNSEYLLQSNNFNNINPTNENDPPLDGTKINLENGSIESYNFSLKVQDKKNIKSNKYNYITISKKSDITDLNKKYFVRTFYRYELLSSENPNNFNDFLENRNDYVIISKKVQLGEGYSYITINSMEYYNQTSPNWTDAIYYENYFCEDLIYKQIKTSSSENQYFNLYIDIKNINDLYADQSDNIKFYIKRTDVNSNNQIVEQFIPRTIFIKEPVQLKTNIYLSSYKGDNPNISEPPFIIGKERFVIDWDGSVNASSFNIYYDSDDVEVESNQANINNEIHYEYKKLGSLGYLSSGLDGSDGIGIFLNDNSKKWFSSIKATKSNTGLAYKKENKSYWHSISEDNIELAATNNDSTGNKNPTINKIVISDNGTQIINKKSKINNDKTQTLLNNNRIIIKDDSIELNYNNTAKIILDDGGIHLWGNISYNS